MELLCVFALALVTSVAGTPHGYGVKSGAVAKAEANAAAGAFEGLPAIPLSIPSGGFSGSFSKSSSSSFASSSASASSSSSSFSFSGTNGITGFRCPFNNCKNGGNSVPPTLNGSHGNEIKNNGGALTGAGSTAASNSYSGNEESAPCNGKKCNSLNITANKCSLGICGLPGNQQDTSNGLHHKNNNDKEESNCALGQCNAGSQNRNSQNSFDSFKCDSGNCFPTAPQHDSSKGNLNSNDKKGVKHPTSDEHDIFIPLSPSTNRAQAVPTPATELSAPNLGPTCTSHNCIIAPGGPDSSTGKLPTSYNVPILGPSSTVSQSDTSINPTGNLYNLPTGTNSLSNCGSAGCSSDISPTDTPSVSSQPSSYTQGVYPSQVLVAPDISPSCTGYNCKPDQQKLNTDVPSYQDSSKKPILCNSPACSYKPATGSSVAGYPSHFDSSTSNTGVPPFNKKLDDNSKTGFVSDNQNLPTYTGGFTKPKGSIHGNVGYTPSYDTTGASKPHFGVSFPTYTGGLNKPTGSVDGNVGYTPSHGSTGSSKPQFDLSAPTYTGGFSKPTGSVDGNIGYTPSHGSTGSSKPQFDASAPTYTGGFSKPTGSVNGNIGFAPSHDSTASFKPQFDASAPTYTGGFSRPTALVDGNVGYTPSHGSTGSSKPQFGASAPTYTGGFSKPTGSVNGNVGYTPSHGSTGSSKPQFDASAPIDTGSFSKPIGSVDGNVGYTPSYGSAESTKPNFDVSAPTYTGGFSKPTGSVDGNVGYTPSHDSTGSPNPQFDVNAPTYTGGFSKPTGSIDEHFGYKPSHSSIGTSKPHSDVGSTTQSVPVYTGGFGGPAGSFDTSFGTGTHFVSKPNHGHAPAYNNNLPHTNNIGGLSSHGTLKPSNSLVPPIYNNPTNNGNFAQTHIPTSVLQAGQPNLPKPVNEKDKSPVYTGGFGGPTGLLKPNEYNLPAKLPVVASNTHAPTSCTSTNCHGKNVPKAIGTHHGTDGISTTSSAAADAKAVAYSGGFGGPSGFLKPFDNDRQSKSEHFEVSARDKFNSYGHTNVGNDSKNKHFDDSKDTVNSGVEGTGVQTSAGGQANAAAQANAIAFASSNTFSSNQGREASGCNSGCGNYNSGLGHNFASSNSLGTSQTHGSDNTGDAAGAAAAAKSIAGASAGSFGTGNSFASSSATAHSSSGASVKGGYGR
ncbi:sericin 1-like [Melitaea cinxia]|uniref:sericin 1-like n=1 Tax=Melitaea cinxia TaxID=113334 RepID=UPI001E2718E7|nr:sericin 1-like [Melitaea cinxia]